MSRYCETPPEEKATELINKFRNEYAWVETDYKADLYRDAKQCAKICVEEILKLDVWGNPHNAEEGRLYWEEVLTHLTP
jgi:hypothetical protein